MTLIHESDVFELWVKKSEVCNPRSFRNDFYDCNEKNLPIIHFLRYALQNIHFDNFFFR